MYTTCLSEAGSVTHRMVIHVHVDQGKDIQSVAINSSSNFESPLTSVHFYSVQEN